VAELHVSITGDCSGLTAATRNARAEVSSLAGMSATVSVGLAHRSHGRATRLAEFAHSLARSLFDPYRPELYYMRGPGPKWHAKHERAPVAYQAVPALVRVRVKR